MKRMIMGTAVVLLSASLRRTLVRSVRYSTGQTSNVKSETVSRLTFHISPFTKDRSRS